MKTLLTEKQVRKIHKGDNHSARTVVKIGDIKKVGRIFKKSYQCVDKIIFKIDTCPYCNGNNTFHKRSQDIYKLDNNRNYDNVYKTYTKKEGITYLYHKIDYCLDCHKEFSIEMFVWNKVK